MPSSTIPVPTCPAATLIAGPPDSGPSVLCGVWFREMREGRIEDAEQGVLITLRSDPSTLSQLCCGEGVPGSPQSYCRCPVWQEERDRIDDGDKSLELSETEIEAQNGHRLAGAPGPAQIDPDMVSDPYFDDMLSWA